MATGKLRTCRRRAAFPRPRTRPIFGRWRNPPTIEKAEEGPGAPDARQGRAAGRGRDAGRARRPAQSGDRQGHRRHRFRHRPDAAAGHLLGAAAGFLRRAHRAQVDSQGVRRGAAERLHRLADHRARSGAGEGTGPRRCDATLAAPRRRRKRDAGVSGLPRADPSRRAPRATSPLRGEVKKESKYRLPRADLPTQPGGFAGIASQQSLERCCARAARNSPANAVDAAPPAAAGKIRRRHRAQDRLRLRAEGRPAAGDQGAGRRRAAPRPHAGAARRHRLGQDLHHGQGDRGDAAPGAHPGAQQDAGRPALRRVQVVLPRQRGGIFRLLLRLLPAGSLRPAHRHLYREGILHQRADRPHAPFGHARAARARRRDHRRLGVLHLRHRLGRDLFGHDLHAQAGRQDRPAPAHRRPGGAAIQAHAGRFLPRLVPRARRHRRHLPGALRGPRLARASVRRRDREDRGDGPAHRRARPTSWNSSRSTPIRITSRRARR